MKTYWKWLIALLVLLGWAIPGRTVGAAGAGYTVTPALPDNQRSEATYFDLLMKKGETQTLTIYVSNVSEEQKVLLVTPTNAFTQTNGEIGYTPNQHRDSSAQTRFTAMTEKAKSVTVAAGATKAVSFKAQIPRSGFTGQVLGSFYVTEPGAKTEQQSTKGVQITNKYALVVGVLLQLQEQVVSPQLELNEVHPGTQNNQAAILANLQNTAPRLFGKMTINAKIYRSGTDQVVLKRQVKNYAFAPNSNFDFGVLSKTPLKPGKYDIDMTVKATGKTWHFRKTFTIDQAQADRIEKALGHKVSHFNWWWGGLGILLVLLLLGGLFWWRRHRQRAGQ